MDMKELTTWVEAHPGESIVIGGGGLLLLMWLLGFFSSTAAPADNTQSSLAAAYYAAEAQQAVVGGQIQQANIAATAQTAQTGIVTSAQTQQAQIAATAATTINAQTGGTYVALGGQQLQMGQTNAATALAINSSNNATNLAAQQASIYGSEAVTAMNTIIPQELAMYGAGQFSLPGFGEIQVDSGRTPNPNALVAQGYSPGRAAGIASNYFAQYGI
jgi:hypothetical protein